MHLPNEVVGMALLILGVLMIVMASVIDWTFRLRMHRVGHRTALILGGAFNYANYRQVRKRYGWSVWPINLMWVLVTCGITLSIAGFFLRFGTHPAGRP